jgi:hydroxymethylpyrimidine/phosphomethylpyrimidine kinase
MKKLILILGGHFQMDNSECCNDWLFHHSTGEHSNGPALTDCFNHLRIPGGENCRGTGCILASAICFYLSEGHGLREAVSKSREYVRNEISKDRIKQLQLK